MDEALAFAASEQPREIAVIGGADIYKAALPRASRIYLTEVHRDFRGRRAFRRSTEPAGARRAAKTAQRRMV